MAWAGSLNNVPYGFLVCDGQAISRTDYADLFSVLGTLHGEGDGSTSFNLPNLQDRFLLGRSNAHEVSTSGGAFATDPHQLTEAEMPTHKHIVPLEVNSQLALRYGSIRPPSFSSEFNA